MVMFWVSLLAISILLYVLLDGVDLGVGLLFGLANGEASRGAMLSAVAPIWDGNETWLVVTAVILWASFPDRLRNVAVGLLSPPHRHAAGPDLAWRGIRISLQNSTAAVDLGSELCRWFPDRDVHTRDDGRCPGGRVAVHERRLFRRRGRLAHAIRGPLRHRPVPWLRASWRLLAGQKMRSRSSHRRAASDTNACGRRAGVPPGSLRLRAGRTPSNPASLDRSAVSVRISGDRSGRRQPYSRSAS